jgi:hypothetical protein
MTDTIEERLSRLEANMKQVVKMQERIMKVFQTWVEWMEDAQVTRPLKNRDFVI